jgi:hypothetical protein
MKPLEINQEQKDKLIEMCEELFPELESNNGECYCNKDQGAGYSYSDEHGECDVCLSKYPRFQEAFHEGIIELSEGIEIHWFEFAMTHLADKIGTLFIPLSSNSDEGKYCFEERFHLNNVLKEAHPIDYLYKQFKLNKK